MFRFYRGVPPRWGLVIFDFYFLHFDAKKYEKEDFNQQRAHQLKHNNCLKHYKVTFGALFIPCYTKVFLDQVSFEKAILEQKGSINIHLKGP